MNLLGVFYLFLVSLTGFGLTRQLPLPKITAFLIGPAVGIIAVTTITLVTSWIFGFTPLTIWLTIIFALITTWLLFNKYSILSSRPSRQASGGIFSIIFRLRRFLGYARNDIFQTDSPDFDLKKLKPRGFLRRHWPLILIFLTIGVYSTYIFLTQVLSPTETGLMTGGGGLYGDTALHSAYTMSLVEQGLPPVNPLFAGQALIYPFMVNFFSATLIKLGLNLRFSFVLPQFIYLTAFIALFYLICKRFTNNLGAFLSILIFSLGWGLGFIPYIRQIIVTGSWTFTTEITNNMVNFHLHNPFTGLLFPERSFLPGLVIGLLITNLVLLTDKVRPKYILIILGILLGILPLWHTHTFIFFAISVTLWLIFPVLTTQKSRFSHILIYEKIIQPLLWVFIPMLTILLPIGLLWLTKLDHDRFLRFSWGWVTSADNQLLFWFKNTGLLIPLAVIGLYKIPTALRKYFYPAILMFFVANLVIFQPWEWDNIKILTWVFLFLSIPVGHTLAVILGSPALAGTTPGSTTDSGRARPSLARMTKNTLVKFMALLIFISLTASGTLSLIKQTQTRFTIYDSQDMELAEWIKANTKPSDVFIIDPWPNHPIPGLTGRSVYLGYPGHLWVHGIDYGERERQVKQILAGNTEILNQLETPVDYIVTDKNSALNNSRMKKFYSNQKFSVIKL